MICSNGIELIKELDRTSDEILPPYNNEKVALVLREMKQLYEQNVEMVNLSRDNLQDNMLALKIRHKALKRNRRCLCAYSWNRIQRIQEMRWQIGSILPAEIKSDMSPAEERWFSNYCKSLASYMKTIGNDGGLNLVQYMTPPKTLYIEVRCLSDVGELQLDDGDVVHLKKNAQYMMLRSQCEPLIRQGILEQVSST